MPAGLAFLKVCWLVAGRQHTNGWGIDARSTRLAPRLALALSAVKPSSKETSPADACQTLRFGASIGGGYRNAGVAGLHEARLDVAARPQKVVPCVMLHIPGKAASCFYELCQPEKSRFFWRSTASFTDEAEMRMSISQNTCRARIVRSPVGIALGRFTGFDNLQIV